MSISNLRVARNADGRLELFYIDANFGVSHRWQTAPNNGWSAEARLGTTEQARSFEVEINLDGRLELFYIGTDGNFYHKWQSSANSSQWSQEHKLSQTQGEEISVPYRVREFKLGRNRTGRIGKNIDGRLELFYTSSANYNIFHKRQTAPNAQTWSVEERLPISISPFNSRLTVGQNKDGRLELFFTDIQTSVIAHSLQMAPDSAQWAVEQLFNHEDTASQLVAAQNADGRQELFYTGTSGNLYHRWQTAPNNGWTVEAPLGTSDRANQVTVGKNADGRLELFYIGTDTNLYHKWQMVPNGNWHPEVRFNNMGSVLEIAVGANADGRLELFYISADKKLYHTWQTMPNGNWSSIQAF